MTGASPTTRLQDRLAHTNDWLMRQGRLTRDNSTLLQAFCEHLRDQGVRLDRCWLHIRALRPNFAGLSRLWQRGEAIRDRPLEYGFESTAAYLQSPVRFAAQNKGFHHWRLGLPGQPEFPVFEELRAEGYASYAITPLVFSDGAVNVISWATREPGGFAPDDLALLEGLLPSLSAVVEINSLRRFTSNLLTTYVGREPGELILSGQVRRGDVRTTTAALMLADLRGFSELSDRHSPDLVIETLNRYFDCLMPPVRRRGGEVMEIMGDAMLVIFNENGERDSREACRLAFEAAKEGLAALEQSNEARGGPDRIVLQAGIALHHGQASYGNIGAEDRLDFTVIGPDVNLTSRIERICREIGRNLIMSANFAALLDEPCFEIGHFDLRGFARKQLLFGL
jgi:adenylate cyclase